MPDLGFLDTLIVGSAVEPVEAEDEAIAAEAQPTRCAAAVPGSRAT